MKKLYLIPLSLLALLLACNGKSVKTDADSTSGTENATQVNYVQSLRLKKPIRGKEYSEGEGVKVVVTPRRKAKAIDSVQIFSNGILQESLFEEPWTGHIRPNGKKMGRNKLKVLAFHSDGSIGLVSTFINLRSAKVPQKYMAQVVKTYEHSRRAYTQGLFFRDGFLYEGTGQKGESFLRKMNLEKGEVLASYELEDTYFGEGVTWCNGKILQLTWNSGKGFVYNPEDFSREYSFNLQSSNNQGWGITCSGKEVFVSDGSNIITVLNPEDYSPLRRIEVYDHKGKVSMLNELEYIQGKIYANVWQTDRIVMIDPASGRVTGDIDLSGLLTQQERNRLEKGDEVLNGIAWDEANQRLFVTGKRWPKLFEIKLEQQ